MTKEEAAKVLDSKGYQAKHTDGIVLVETDNPEDYGKIGKILKKAGYNASYGWKKKHEREEKEAPGC